jgi:hypothetical protein
MYARQQTDDGSWETVWLIYDEATWLASIGPNPAVKFRAAAFDEGGVVVLPILLRLGRQESGGLYDTWMNAYQIEGENVHLQDVARQNQLRIHLFADASQPIQTLIVPNRLQALASAVLVHQADYQPSTAAAFEYARGRCLANYADLQALWHALAPR